MAYRFDMPFFINTTSDTDILCLTLNNKKNGPISKLRTNTVMV